MQQRDDAGPGRPAAGRRSRNALLLGLALAGVFGAAAWKHHQAQPAPEAAAPAQSAQSAQPMVESAPQAVRLADFAGDAPSPDAQLMANWVVATHDSRKRAFILVDKKDARVYVFTPDGRLKNSAPALLGAAHGDVVPPGVGAKPLAQVQPDEKTTPAGRFVADPGLNADHEDVIWVDYDDAISMHRVRPWVARERRLERLASLTTDDNRISFGCINLPVSFYEDVAKPAVAKYGAVIYVLPEVKSLQQVFGAYDVTDPAQVAAAHRQASLADAGGKAAPARPAAQG